MRVELPPTLAQSFADTASTCRRATASELGRTLHAPLEALSRWAEEHIEEVLMARETYDAHC